MKLKDIEANPVMPSVLRVIEVLDGAPADEVYSVDEMVEKFRVSQNALNRAFRPYPAYRTRYGNNRTLWGNPKAIKALLRKRGVAR